MYVFNNNNNNNDSDNDDNDDNNHNKNIMIIMFLIHMGIIKLLYTCLVIFFERQREYNNCLISFLSFSESFPAFN